MAVNVLSHEDIRLFLVDKSPDDNFLLDAVDFTDEEIQKAIEFAVDRFNTLPPIIHIIKAENLPRYLLVTGASAILLRMRAINQVRNRLDYQQRIGTAVQDKNKAAEYLALSRELWQEFETTSRNIKTAHNIQAAYGSLGSPYAFGEAGW